MNYALDKNGIAIWQDDKVKMLEKNSKKLNPDHFSVNEVTTCGRVSLTHFTGFYGFGLKHICPDEIEVVEQSKTWRPMDTAPKDGSNILIYDQTPSMLLNGESKPRGIYISYWWKGDGLNSPKWRDGCVGGNPVRWMPLPDAPL